MDNSFNSIIDNVKQTANLNEKMSKMASHFPTLISPPSDPKIELLVNLENRLTSIEKNTNSPIWKTVMISVVSALIAGLLLILAEHFLL